MGNKKQLAINMATQVGSFIVSMIVSFFVTSFVVEKIGADVYGFVGLSNNITNYVVVFTIAINSLANRYITIAYTKKDITGANTYFSSVTAANMVVTAVIFIPAVIFLVYLEKFINIPPGHELDVKLLLSLVFLMFSLQLVFGRMEVSTFATNRLDLSALANFKSNILKLILLASFYTLLAPKVAYVGVSALLCALYVIILNARYMKKLTPELHFSRKLVKSHAVTEMVKNGVWNSTNHMSQILFDGLDLLIANLFIGAAGMGLLSISKTLPVHIITFIGIIAGVFYPSMTVSYAKGNTDDFINECISSTRVCGCLCSVPIIGFIVFGKEFYQIWLPSMSQADITQIYILTLLTILPQFFSIYVYPLYQVNTLTCKLKIPSFVNIFLGVANIVIVFLLLKFTNLGLYAIAGVSSFLLVIRIVFFVPMYAAYSLERKLTTFYGTLAKGIFTNLILIALFIGIKMVIAPVSIIAFVCAILVCALAGYILSIGIMFRREDLEKVLKKIRK